MTTVITRSASRRLRCTEHIEIIDSDDESDVIYIKPPSPPFIDLTRAQSVDRELQTASPTVPTTPEWKNKQEDPKLGAKTPTILLEKLAIITPQKTRAKRKIATSISDKSNKSDKDGYEEESVARGPTTPPKQKKTGSPTKGRQDRRSLFPKSNDKDENDCAENAKNENKQNKSLSKENSIYQSARRALHSTEPSDMPGREKEISFLRDFIKEHLDGATSGSLYISGPPGTGKTAALNLIIQRDQIASKLKHVYINCTGIKSAGSIYMKIMEQLGLRSHARTEKDCSGVIEHYLIKSHKTILLVLDEIDQLDSKNQSVLYTIFEWPSKPHSNLILIGIANALDLTDRTLPRLQARCELKPELMHFAPYTKQQIIDIFTVRLKEAGAEEVFAPMALQMLAAKVAAISGDVRRALDIGRRVIEMLDDTNNTIFKPLNDNCQDNNNININNNNNNNKVKSVNLKHVMDVLSNVYGASQNLSSDVDDSFPLQQKIIVCCISLMLKKARNKNLTIGSVYEVYRKVCNKRNIQIVDQAEFVGICSLVETRGIIRIIKKKDPKLSKVTLEWDEEEVGNTLQDKQLLSAILRDDNCLGKI